MRLGKLQLLALEALLGVAAVLVWVAPLGVNVGDGGYVLAQAWRVLHAELPHRDFISPRPAGSAYLHLVEFALPLPLDFASRLTTTLEFMASAILLGSVVVGASLRRLTWWQVVLLPSVAFLGDMHMFPLIPFYTIDGLFLSGLGLYAIERWRENDDRRMLIGGALAVGGCLLLKQSFWPLGAIAFVRVASKASKRQLLEAVAAAVFLPCIYLVAIAAGGALGEMKTQLFTGDAVYGSRLWLVYARSTDTQNVIVDAVVVISLALGVLEIRRFPATIRRLADAFIRAAATGVVLLIALSGQLGLGALWAFNLFWCAAGVLVLRSIVQRRVDYGGLVACAMGWMVTLSWGAPRPDLAGGLLIVYLLNVFWSPPLVGRTQAERALPIAAALVAATATAVVFGLGRAEFDYGGGTTSNGETHSLASTTDRLAWLRVDRGTQLYFSAIRQCLDRYPADRLAVIPTGVLVPVAFKRTDPFPIDLFWYQDYHASRQRILDAVPRINAQGNYLVLFATPASDLLGANHLAAAHAADATRPLNVYYDEPITGAINGGLAGQAIACWPFVGRWAPPKQAE